jgi:heme/copper-type cytochrome/quinol oxidase subunit 2
MDLDGIWWSIPLTDSIAVAIISVFVIHELRSIGKDETEAKDGEEQNGNNQEIEDDDQDVV